jgi:hypothetical protein
VPTGYEVHDYVNRALGLSENNISGKFDE